jgi:hypothetical protein
LVLCPLVVTALPGWLFYEITIANMAAPSDDRSTRLRLWMLVSGPLLTLVLLLAAATLDASYWALVATSAIWLFAALLAFLVAGEPLGPSARVEARWQQRAAGRLRRWLGPGVARAGAAALVVSLVTLGASTGLGVVLAKSADGRWAALSLGGYAAAFSLFLIGFVVWSRARAHAGGIPRVLAAGALFVALLGPYIVLAIAGILGERGDHVPLLAAPSPAFAFVVVERYHSLGGSPELYGLAGAMASAGWALLGIGLFAVGTLTARRRWAGERAERQHALEPKPVPGPAA